MDGTRPVLVWDWPVRIFHWLTVILVSGCYVTWRANWMDWHAWAGEALLALVLFRVLWGVFGSDTARFARFVAPPGRALRHLAHLFRREPDLGVGHNPAGGWMVLLLLALLLGQTVTGIYINNDIADAGPFTDMMPAAVANAISDLHGILWNTLLAAAALHVLVILVYAVAKRHDLVRPMLTGRKRLPAEIPAPRTRGGGAAILLLVLAAGLTVVIATAL
jgi:cytochrome b